MSKFIPAEEGKRSFNCPSCGVFAEQAWSKNISCVYDVYTANGSISGQSTFSAPKTRISKCMHCNEISIWRYGQMIFPLTGNVELANEDLPEDIKGLYNEAKNIVNLSPKGSAALLRLCLQKLCGAIGEKGKNINEDIASLVTKGLPVQVQQALDVIRVTGNNAVHPGEIDLNDNPETALTLFRLINIIAHHFITQPKMIATIYGSLPQKDRDNIAKRDS